MLLLNYPSKKVTVPFFVSFHSYLRDSAGLESETLTVW